MWTHCHWYQFSLLLYSWGNLGSDLDELHVGVVSIVYEFPAGWQFRKPRETCSSQQQSSVQKLSSANDRSFAKRNSRARSFALVNCLPSCILVILLSELFVFRRRESRDHWLQQRFAHYGFEGGLETLEGGRIQLLPLWLVFLTFQIHLLHEVEQGILSFRQNRYYSRWCDECEVK